MINHISIKNFATIEQTEVDFENGLNIITGETGAGKSILIEAISLALGSRADTSMIRTGHERASVQLLGELNGEEIIISRELSASGKNISKLNGEIVTLSSLNEVSSKLADIHGQYDNQFLFNPENHIDFLDCYRKTETYPLRKSLSEKYTAFANAKSELASLLRLERDNARKKDFYTFEIAEIEKANLRINEDTELEDKISILQNSEKIFEKLAKANALLSDGSPSVNDALGQVINHVSGLSAFGKEFADCEDELNDIYYRLKDISSVLSSKLDSLTFSPNELDDAISRLNTIDNLKKKYGSSIEEITGYHDKISKELSIIDNFDDEKLKLERNLITFGKELLAECDKLTKLRKEIASELSKRIEDELLELNFKDAKIEIRIEQSDAPTVKGIDRVEIFVSLNLGEDLKPLAKVASGGEMSRIMLAFKNIISSYDGIPTLIFDEIDNGISGITASIVGNKLSEIAENHQVICITHLPQIAAKGDYNYRIAKDSDDSNTFTHIEQLDEEGKIAEIARLLGGTNITENTLKSAAELVNS